MACRYSPAMTLERGERIEVVGLQRKKQASNPILKKFSRVKKLCGRFFYARWFLSSIVPSRRRSSCTSVTFLCPLLEAARAYGGLALAVRWSGHIRPSRTSLRLFFRILFGYSRMRRPAREALNAGVVHAACNVCRLRGILSRM